MLSNKQLTHLKINKKLTKDKKMKVKSSILIKKDTSVKLENGFIKI